jgi:hypothetical protein
VKKWSRDGDTVVGRFDRQEAAVVRGLVSQIQDMLLARAEEAPQDELEAAFAATAKAPDLADTVSFPVGCPC